MKRRALRITALLLPITASLSIACSSATEPMPEGTRRISAPPIYHVWWSLTEVCSARSGRFSSIDWYVVPEVAQFRHKDDLVSGYWSRSGNRIVIAERAMFDGGLVRHEILHALTGEARHSRDAFLERCGGTVVCLAGCLEDAEPGPVVGAAVARVDPADMLINVTVDPDIPDRSIDGGHFRLVVTVTNPRTDSVMVQLPSKSNAPPASFSFLLNSGRIGLWFTEHAWDAGVMVFGPRATRKAVFDFVLADRFDGIRALPEGTYEVQGGFGPATSTRHSFVFGDGQ